MPSKRLIGVWTFLNVCLLGAGIMTLVLSIMWREPNLLRNMVVTGPYLACGLVLGIMFLVTWAISVGAIIQPNHITFGLVFLNWSLILDALAIVTIGTFIWFFTLQERKNYHSILATQSAATRIAVQDKLHCCGYFNSTDLLEIGGSFCQNQTFADSINNTFCVGPLTAYADVTLNDIFTTIYGWMAIVVTLFLATLCVINKRHEGERFRKINEKRGGRGFV